MDLMFQPLRKYADFQGRARRSEYWLFQLFMWGVIVVLWTFSIIFGGSLEDLGSSTELSVPEVVFGGVLAVFFLAMLIPNFAVRIRRLHDIGVTGWVVLVGMIPYLGGLILFVLALIDGNAGRNTYGPDPKGRGAEPSLADTFS